MRIGITCHPTAGGSGILATELGIALSERGHEVHFVTYGPLFRLQNLHENIFCHYALKSSYPLFQHPPMTLSLVNRIYEVAIEHDIDIWHAHYAIPHATCALYAREMLPQERLYKIVTTLHGTDITLVGSDPSFYQVTRHAIARSDAVTSVSRWLTEETLRTFDLDIPIHTIYNFLNPSLLERKPEKRCKFAAPDEKVIMHISNFRPVKRVTDVVRVFKRIADQLPAQLIMVGDGPERMSAVGVARQLGIENKVRFMGTYENIESILPCADLVLQPSEHESFGLVPLEAMAFGIPVVATASGGICEVVEDGVTGCLCEVGDIEAMARCALDILGDEERTRKMAEQARNRARTVFSRERAVDAYEALYRRLLEES